jgi:hypothetical protein
MSEETTIEEAVYWRDVGLKRVAEAKHLLETAQSNLEYWQTRLDAVRAELTDHPSGCVCRYCKALEEQENERS